MRVESFQSVHYVVTLYLTILLVVLPSTSEARAMWDYEDEENSMAGPPIWHPASGSREDWLRCHGISCEDWDRTKRKLFELKMATAGTGYDTGMLNETEDSLDNCIWLTEKQIDEIMIQINAFEDSEEEESYVGQGQGQSQGQGQGQGQDQGQGQSQGQGQGRDRPQRRQKRKILDFESEAFKMWPMPIHWKFDGMHNADEQEIIRGAFRHWQAQTCVRFQELAINQSHADHHILITKEEGCLSFIGRIRSFPQQLDLQNGCMRDFGIPVHEIGHVLGLGHEQQRWDRDDHIRVNWNNVGSYVGQFMRIETPDLGVEYDHGSVMHYSPYDGSKNALPTMEALNPWYTHNMGQRTGLSFNDAKIINLAYCADTCPTPLPQACLRNGYQDPNDCSTCKCPDGFSGKYCDHAARAVRAVCGGDVTATSAPQKIQSPGYNNPGFYDGRPECSWLITAPVDHHVVFRFEDEFGLYCHNQLECHHWVEVRYSMGLDIPGPRFCCHQRPDVTIRSESNEMMVSFKTNYTVPSTTDKRGFKFSFFSEPSTAAATTLPTPSVRPATTTTTTARPTTRPTTYTTVTGPSVDWNCSFEPELELCGITQELADDQFDWTIMTGSTPSDETGPSEASDGRYYIYIEASNPRAPGDRAILHLPRLEAQGTVCLQFSYHMYGFHVDTLKVTKKTPIGEVIPAWIMSGDQGNQWRHASVSVAMNTDDRLDVIGIRGNEYSGDIAIDDLHVTSGTCR